MIKQTAADTLQGTCQMMKQMPAKEITLILWENTRHDFYGGCCSDIHRGIPGGVNLGIWSKVKQSFMCCGKYRDAIQLGCG
jgi:hypothetical protein